MNDPTCFATPRLNQPRRGYRFSADAMALAEFAQAGPSDSVLDLCSGCGVIPILMWHHAPFSYGLGVELDAELAALARSNVAQFHLKNKIQILQTDVRSLDSNDLQVISPFGSSGRFDVLTANPPYWPADSGRLNPNLQKAAARHEISLTLAELLAAARRFLKPGGRFYLCHLESRKSEILENLERADFVIRKIQSVSALSGRLLFEAHLDNRMVKVPI